MWDSGTPNQNGVSLLAFIEENDYSLQNTIKSTHMVFNAGLKCSLINLNITSPSISHKCSLEVTNVFMGSDPCVMTQKSTIMFHILHNICLGGPLTGQTGMHFTIYARGGQTCSKKEPLAENHKHQRAAKSVDTK